MINLNEAVIKPTIQGIKDDWNKGLEEDFKRISDLKKVIVSDTIGEHNGEFYSGKDQSQTTNNTRFYRIDDNYIVTNCPPLIELK